MTCKNKKTVAAVVGTLTVVAGALVAKTLLNKGGSNRINYYLSNLLNKTDELFKDKFDNYVVNIKTKREVYKDLMNTIKDSKNLNEFYEVLEKSYEMKKTMTVDKMIEIKKYFDSKTK